MKREKSAKGGSLKGRELSDKNSPAVAHATTEPCQRNEVKPQACLITQTKEFTQLAPSDELRENSNPMPHRIGSPVQVDFGIPLKFAP